MLNYYDEEIDFSEEDWFDSLELLIGQYDTEASYEELEDNLDEILESMSDQEAESFLKSFGNVASSIGKGLLKSAPTIAKVAGTMMGGPMVGNLVGSAVGGMMGGQPGAGNINNATQVNPQAPSFSTTPAANQLMILINNPKFLVPLLRAITGQRNNLKEEIILNNKRDEISISDMLETLSILSRNAAIELADEDMYITDSYLKDESGNYLVDEKNPEEKAELLLNKLYLNEELIRSKS